MLNKQTLENFWNAHICYRIILLFGFLLLVGCVSDSTNDAPVKNAWYESGADQSGYRVKSGDTIYSVAWAFGLDYRALVEANHLNYPYAIHAGQMLQMTHVPRGTWQSHPVIMPIKIAPVVHSTYPYQQPLRTSIVRWMRPAKGPIVEYFSQNLAGNKGIDIKGYMGEPVKAAAEGTVVYSGDGIRGYGKLIIIKHNDHYLSAYAYNQHLWVHLNDHVKIGQVIATMGRNDAGKTRLHFEIRRDGRAINPLNYLN